MLATPNVPPLPPDAADRLYLLASVHGQLQWIVMAGLERDGRAARGRVH
jgi:hypothetical protein